MEGGEDKIQKKLVHGNLVVLLTQSGKGNFDLSQLAGLYPEDPLGLMWPPQAVAPGVVTFTKKQREMSIIGNRLQIDGQLASEAEVMDDFLAFAKKVLSAAGNQNVSAYGFNFDFICSGSPEVKNLFNISIKESSFTYLPQTQIKLSFQKDKLSFTLEVIDGDSSGLGSIHVNIHTSR